MIGAVPKNINKEIVIPGGQKTKGLMGALNILGKNSPQGEFQALIGEEALNSEGSEITTQQLLKGQAGKFKEGSQILGDNGLLLKKEIAPKKINTASLEDWGSKSDRDQLEKIFENREVKPLRLGLSSSNNQKYDKKIAEFISNRPDINLIKNHERSGKILNGDWASANVNTGKIGQNASLLNFSKYQKMATRENDNVIKMNTGDSKGSKTFLDAQENIASDNLLDFALKQNLNDGTFEGQRGFSEHKSIMPELQLLKNERTMNLDHLNVNDPKALIDKISNYIVEKSFERKDSVDLVVKHAELGEFRINASKLRQGERIDLEIITSSDKGHRFFVDNEQAMVKSLSNSGIKIVDLKISTGHESQMSNQSQDGNSFSKEHSFFNKTAQYSFDERPEGYEEDSQRRKMLWEMFKERKEA